MPALGDQHNNAPANPFEEAKPRISEYTARELAVLQGRLQQQLGPEFISTRKGPGGKNVHYIASDKVIGLANDVFGFNGWSSAIRDIQVDFVDENTQTRKVDVGLSVIVRVTLRDGTYHEDIGYGHIENCSGKAAAFEKAKKEGTTDALKRTLRNFGNVLGNCVYDKDYLAKVTKIKVRPTRFAEENLHRHSDFALPKPEGVREGEGNQNATVSVPANQSADRSDTATIKADENEDFTSVDFDDADFSFSELEHQDAMVIEPRQPAEIQRSNIPPQNTAGPTAPSFGGRPQSIPPPRPPLPQEQIRQHPNSRHTPGTHLPPNQSSGPKPNSVGNVSRPGNPRMASTPVPASNGPRPGPPNFHQQRSISNVPQQSNPPDLRPNMASNTNNNGPASALLPGEMPVPANAPTGFVPGRSAEHAQKADGSVPAFNPHTESPSIRRTAGFDHTKTSSVKRTAVPWTSPAGNAPQGQAGAQSDMAARRVGAPVQHNSPLSNRAQFKPVGKRPAETDLTHSSAQNGQSNTSQSLRQALSDVTAGAVNVPGTNGEGPPDMKKQKLETETLQAKETLTK